MVKIRMDLCFLFFLFVFFAMPSENKISYVSTYSDNMRLDILTSLFYIYMLIFTFFYYP